MQESGFESRILHLFTLKSEFLATILLDYKHEIGFVSATQRVVAGLFDMLGSGFEPGILHFSVLGVCDFRR